jgi:hypothetical protein
LINDNTVSNYIRLETRHSIVKIQKRCSPKGLASRPRSWGGGFSVRSFLPKLDSSFNGRKALAASNPRNGLSRKTRLGFPHERYAERYTTRVQRPLGVHQEVKIQKTHGYSYFLRFVSGILMPLTTRSITPPIWSLYSSGAAT